jgi:hypothetical protein
VCDTDNRYIVKNNDINPSEEFVEELFRLVVRNIVKDENRNKFDNMFNPINENSVINAHFTPLLQTI